MRDFQSYIFDLDGTLLNTLDDLAASTNYALRLHGFAERSTEEVRLFVGNGVGKLIERAVPEGTPAEETRTVLATFRQYYLEHDEEHTVPYPGITDLLEELHHRGKCVAVVSNKFSGATQRLCNNYFGRWIQVVIGEREGIRRKPAPDSVLEALSLLGMPKEGAVYVGDSDVDILTAKNSGIPCVSVLWGFRDQDFLLQHGATTFVRTPLELLP